MLFKKRIIGIVGIALSVISIMLLFVNLYTYRGNGLYPAVFAPRSIYYYIGLWIIIPILLYASNIVLSILNICQKDHKRLLYLNIVMDIVVVVTGIIMIIVGYHMSSLIF